MTTSIKHFRHAPSNPNHRNTLPTSRLLLVIVLSVALANLNLIGCQSTSPPPSSARFASSVDSYPSESFAADHHQTSDHNADTNYIGGPPGAGYGAGSGAGLGGSLGHALGAGLGASSSVHETHGAQLATAHAEHLGQSPYGTAEELAAKKTVKLSVDKEVTKEVDLVANPGELLKLFLNPVELVKAICVRYKLHSEKFIAAIGKSLVFGLEAALTPFAITIKLIEKVFVPDPCRMQFVCKLGANVAFLKQHVPPFSPTFGAGSELIKGFGEGVLGHDCYTKYACQLGEPRLKREYQSLKKV